MGTLYYSPKYYPTNTINMIMKYRSKDKFAHVKPRVDSGLQRKQHPSSTLRYKSHSCINLTTRGQVSPIKLPSFNVSRSPSTKRPATCISNQRQPFHHPQRSRYDIEVLTAARDEIQALEEVILTQEQLIKNSMEYPPSRNQQLAKVTTTLESTKQELNDERAQNATLRKEVMLGKIAIQKQHHLERRIVELEEENRVLQLSLKNCMMSCFSEIKNSSKPRESYITSATLTSSTPTNRKHLQIIESQQQQIQLLQQKLLVVDTEKRSLKEKLYTQSLAANELQEDNEKLRIQVDQLITQLGSSRSDTNTTNSRRTNNWYHDLSNQQHHQPSIFVQSKGPQKGPTTSSLELTSQVEQMQRERDDVLKEFAEMKNLLEQIQESMKSGEDEDTDYNYE